MSRTPRPRRRDRPDASVRPAHAVLHPAVAEAAQRVGATAVGLIEVRCAAGLHLNVDRVGITYGDGRVVGDPTSPVQVTCSVRGDRPVPARALPPVVARIGLDRDPLDVTDADDARRLRARLPPDRPDLRARLEAEIALAVAAPPLLLRGDPIDLVADAVARVDPGALPVVTTAWALSAVPRERRPDLLRRLADAASDRTVAWVSVEGVGVAPGVPTLGDRPASGHSIVGLTVVDGAAAPAEVLGRCWARGAWLAWLAGS